ncbi:hypothetical protein VTJ49DRAFT_4188 [Mycothermus thermophilus]|uniref:Uncharacterized protein n=1 Tax=Humicola insolens TaxID=85995 RepID=A0ABR3V602_HUMIN
MGPTAKNMVFGANTNPLGYTPASFAEMSAPYQPNKDNETPEGSHGAFDDDVGPTLALLSEVYAARWDDWTHKRDDALVLPRVRRRSSRRRAKCPRGLASMCLRVLADNIHAADRKSIDDIRLDQRWQLWKKLTSMNMSLHAWNIVGGSLASSCQEWLNKEKATAAEQRQNLYDAPAHGRYGADKERMLTIGMYRYHKEIFDPKDVLIPYLIPMVRLDQCLVHLCLDDVARFRQSDLVFLTDLPLRVLELIQREDPKGNVVLDDRLYRAWAERAEKTQGFSELLVLRIISEWDTISETGFEQLSKLPSLGIVDIALPGRLHPMPGWTRVHVSQDATFFEAYTRAFLGHGLKIDLGVAVDISNMYYADAFFLKPITDFQSLRSIRPHQGNRRGQKDQAKDEIPERTGTQIPEARQPWHMAVHQVFAFLGLYDHKAHKFNGENTGFALAVNRIPVPNRRFVHIRLSTIPGVPPRSKRLNRVIYVRSACEMPWGNTKTGRKDEKEKEPATSKNPGQNEATTR